MTNELTLAMKNPHGTRVRYVLGCRCKPCTAANLALYHARQKQIAEHAVEVRPSGPALEGELVRAGKIYRVRRCPGANGKPCVKGGAWLRIGDVCKACIERATVWNGLVETSRVRRHLQRLSRVGVGRRSVADIAGVALSSIHAIKTGRKRRIRAQLERRILAVTKDVMNEATLVDAKPTWKRIGWLLRQGFTRQELARRLGSKSKTPALQLKTDRITARKALAVERLYRSFQ
jgi:predicted amidophosphoribosyltransferase